jgi:hypothetical protein
MLTFTDKINMIRYDYPPLPSLELPETNQIKAKRKRYLSDYFYQGNQYDIRGYFHSTREPTSIKASLIK